MRHGKNENDRSPIATTSGNSQLSTVCLFRTLTLYRLQLNESLNYRMELFQILPDSVLTSLKTSHIKRIVLSLYIVPNVIFS